MNTHSQNLFLHPSPLLLPENWEISEIFHDQLEFIETPVSVAGIVAQNKITKKMIHGSAADYSKEKATLRAYYELIERISILELHSPQHELTEGLTRPSLSNGIAIHTDLELAKQNAALELLERDAILSHWFQARSPIEYLDQEHKMYEFKTKVQGISTWMTLIEKPNPTEGFPTLWIGYGTHPDRLTAIHKSKLEALQSACFTHDVELATELPEYAGAELHLDFLLSKLGNQTLKRWLQSPRYVSPTEHIQFSEIKYDIYEMKLGSETLYSVKARSEKLQHLTFGVPAEFRGELCSYQLLLQDSPPLDYRALPHPIA